MIRAFFAALTIEAIALFALLVVVAILMERMSIRPAEIALLVFGGIDLLAIVASVWIYRALATVWADAAVAIWSLVLFGVLATLTGAFMFLAAMMLLNR